MLEELLMLQVCRHSYTVLKTLQGINFIINSYTIGSKIISKYIDLSATKEKPRRSYRRCAGFDFATCNRTGFLAALASFKSSRIKFVPMPAFRCSDDKAISIRVNSR